MNHVDLPLQGTPQPEPSRTTAATAGASSDKAMSLPLSDRAMSLPSSKVQDGHRQRKALVYIRQSTPQQVIDHRESADRQYSLVHRATFLGWAPDRVEVVD